MQSGSARGRGAGGWRAALLALGALAPCEGSAARGVDRSPPVASGQVAVEEVRLVQIQAVVTNRKGQPVEGLTAADFLLFEDGVPQEVHLFAPDGATPVSVVFLLDVSASMGLRDQLDEAKRAIRSLVAASGPRTRFGLICFADDRVAWITPATADRELFARRLEEQQPGGRTALFDALAAGARLVEPESRGQRTALVLFTDGLDNASALPVLTAVALARRVNVPIYTLPFVPLDPALAPRRIRDSLATLERFSRETGGSLYPIHDPVDVEGAVAAILRELRHQYVVGYYPSDTRDDGRFRRIELRPRAENLRVRTRAGYDPTR